MIVLDTSVLAYALGTDHPLRGPARRIFEALEEGRISATTTPDVLQEFVHVYSRRRPRSEAVAHARRWALGLTPLFTSTEHDLARAFQLYERHERLDSFDALLAAVTLREEAEAFVSADRAFEDVPKLPFVELGSPELDRLLG